MPDLSSSPPTLRLRHGRLPVTTALWCLRIQPGVKLPRESAQWQRLHSGPHSRIYGLQNETGLSETVCVAKFARPRSVPRDSVRKYAACQAYREYRGHHLLADAGLNTLAVRGWGLTLNPRAEFESVLFMDPLPPSMSALQLIRQETDTETRLGFFDSLADELARLHAGGRIHKDCHFDNIRVLADRTLLWIDNDIRRPSRWSTCRRGLNKSITLLQTTARTAVSNEEWHYFKDALKTRLSQLPDGEHFLHELS